MPWTRAQQAAIDARGKNILVSAAAGSGKTAVLTERVFGRVLGSESEAPIDIDKLLIVTFTSAAANEMKERIGDKISKYIEELQTKEDSDIEKQRTIVYLERQIALLSKASISTIHSFCLKLIKSYFNELDIDPNIRVGNDAELATLRFEILDELLEEQFEAENNEGFLSVADTYGSVRGMEPLVERILEVHTFSKSTVFPSQWLREKTDLLTQSYSSLEETPWSEELILELKGQLEGIEAIYHQAIKTCNEPGGPKLYEEVLKADFSQLEVIDKSSLWGLVEGINRITFMRLPGKKQECDPMLKENVKESRTGVKKIIENLQKSTKVLLDPKLLEKTQVAGEVIGELVKLVELFDRRYYEAKKDKGLVDYSDLEHLCLKLLIKQDDEGQIIYTDVAKEQSAFYQEVYIDEYQDSNLVQETILGAIAKASDTGTTQFMVGDMKQSIYRFRLANPLIFANKYENWEKYEEESESQDACIDLSKNFRSRENILEGINDVFDQVMSKQVGELVYDEDAKLKVGNEYTEGVTEDVKDGLSDAIELHLIQTGVEEEEDVEELKGAELEAKVVATQIECLLNGEGNPRYVFDKEKKGYRLVEARDIVILLRTKTNAALFEEALLERGIDAYAEVNSNFFEAMEIKTLLSLLQIIDNPMQDIGLLAVLRSPIVGVDFDELVRIRQIDRTCSFYKVFKQYVSQSEASELLIEFDKQLEEYRDEAAMLTVSELINKLLVDTGYYRYVGALPAGSKKKANLRMLKQYAEEFEKTNATGLFGFLNYLERLSQTNTNLEQAKVAGGSENFVNIMTIHKSKGLEFPVVFLSQSSKKFNNKDIITNLLLHNTGGFGPKHLDYEEHVIYDTIPFVAIKNKIVSENLSEEMRVLYVALTRAKEKLYVTGTVKNIEKAVQGWAKYAMRKQEAILPLGVKQSPNYLSWIGMSLFALESFSGVRDIVGERPDYLFNGNSRWHLECWKQEDITIAKEESEKVYKEKREMIANWNTEEVYTQHRQEIFDKLSYTYPYLQSTHMPTQITVTALKGDSSDTWIKKEEESIKEIPLPKFMRREDELIKGATKGTMIHGILEQLDYITYRDQESIRQELERLKDQGLIEQESLEVVDIDRLVSLANSEVVEEMRGATEIAKEKPFVYLMNAKEVDETYSEEEEILLQGIVDMYYIKNNQIHIVDYKTDYIDLADIEGSISKIRQRYSMQLSLYAKALSHILELEVANKFIYLYSINKWIEA